MNEKRDLVNKIKNVNKTNLGIGVLFVLCAAALSGLGFMAYKNGVDANNVGFAAVWAGIGAVSVCLVFAVTFALYKFFNRKNNNAIEGSEQSRSEEQAPAAGAQQSRSEEQAPAAGAQQSRSEEQAPAAGAQQSRSEKQDAKEDTAKDSMSYVSLEAPLTRSAQKAVA